MLIIIAPPTRSITLPGSEEAVEYDELDKFLRLNETWNADIDEERPAPPAKPIGVPGAVSPLQMTPDHLKTKILAQKSSPLRGKGSAVPVNKREGEFDFSTELPGYGLQGVQVTEDELRGLIEELGLGGDDAGDLLKGLSSSSPEKDDTKSEAGTKASEVDSGSKPTAP